MQKHNGKHKALFAENMGSKLGTPKDKGVPWGLPPGHSARESFLAPPPTPASPVSRAGPSGVNQLSAASPGSQASPKKTVLPTVPSYPGPSPRSLSSRPKSSALESSAPESSAHQSSPPESSPAARQSSRVRAKGGAPSYNDESESESEVLESSSSEDSTNSDSETRPDPAALNAKSRRKRATRPTQVKLSAMPHTEDEGSGDESSRKVNKRNQRSKMVAALGAPPPASEKWVPDAQDTEDLQKHVTKWIMMNSSKYKRQKNRMPIRIKNMIEAGVPPTQSADYRYFSKSYDLFTGALGRLLGKMQRDILQATPDKLPDGRLHLRQFFAVRTDHFIKLRDPQSLINEFHSPNVKSQVLTGYKYLVKAVVRWASSYAADQVFRTPIDDNERSWNIPKMEETAELRQTTFKNGLHDLIVRLGMDGQQGQFSGDVSDLAGIRKEGRKVLEGAEIPDPNIVVPLFLYHDDSLEMEDFILKSAEARTVLSDKDFTSITEYLLTRFLCKMGNRPDMLGDMTWEEYWEGDRKPPAAYPHSPVPQNLVDSEASVKEWVRPNPWGPDPNDPNDTYSADPEDPVWTATQGVCVEVRFHKTGASYLGYVFFNTADTVFIKAYEELSFIKLKHKSGNPDYEFPANMCAFVRPSGQPFLTSKRVLNIGQFCLRAGLPKQRAYMFRHMASNALYNAKSGLLKDAEQFALCHGKATATSHYLSESRKKILALAAHTFYRSLVDREAELVQAKYQLIATSKEQAGRRKRSLENVDEMTLNLVLDKQHAVDNAFIPNERRAVGDNVRVALVETILASRDVNLSRFGSPMMLLTNTPVRRVSSYLLILRMLYSMPSDHPSVAILLGSLLLYSRMQGDNVNEVDIRQVELKWVDKLIGIIQLLQRLPNGIANTRLLHSFAKVALATDGYIYCCGNENIQSQMLHWKTMLRQRQASREASVKVISSVEWVETFRQEREKLKEASHTDRTRRQTAKLPVLEDEDVLEQDDEEVEQAQVEVHVGDQVLTVQVNLAINTQHR